MLDNIKLYPISDSYSFGPDYDINSFVYENGELIKLLDSKNSVYINVENFVGGGESVSFELVAYNGIDIVLTSHLKFFEDTNGILKRNYTIYSEQELPDKLKSIIEQNCKDYFSIIFVKDVLTVDKDSFFEDINEYKGNNLLYDRISKKDIENLIKELEDKQCH